MSVRIGPAICLHLWRSSRYLRISPLHLEFRLPLPTSRLAVCPAVPRLSRGISQDTDEPACAPFKPSDSDQRSGPSYYRGCWHEVSRPFLWVWSKFLNPDSGLHTRGASSHTRHCSVTLSRIAEDSSLQPPVGVRAVSQSRCGGSCSHTR